MSAIDVGLPRKEALRLAPDFLRRLRDGKLKLDDVKLTDGAIDVLHAACEIIDNPDACNLTDAENLYCFTENAEWPDPCFAEKDEVKADCAFVAWRVALGKSAAAEADLWLDRFRRAAETLGSRYPLEESRLDPAATSTDPPQGPELPNNLQDLLLVLEELRKKWESDPQHVYRLASVLYASLMSQPEDLTSESHYVVGELARMIGGACRNLGRREEGRRWLEVAETEFRHGPNAATNLARVEYHRLAICLEERDFLAISARLPGLVSQFETLGLAEDGLKARLLGAAVTKESGEWRAAIVEFAELAEQAELQRNEYLLGHALTNLSQAHAFLGDEKLSLAFASKAAPLLSKLGNRVSLAKLYWSIGTLFANRGKVSDALGAYRVAMQELNSLSMIADVAAVHLQVADLWLEVNDDQQAVAEIRQALPIIDEYKLVPEGMAAITLLRESLRRQNIDRGALRRLREHFEREKS